MNIVKPYARILSSIVPVRTWRIEDGIAMLRRIEWCARISHRSEEMQKEESWERFLTAVVLQHGDWSVTEHASVTVDFLVDRGITHELVRHRLFSYTQESTRFVNYEKKMPPSFITPSLDDASARDWRLNIETCESTYRDMVQRGCPPQIARSVFPNALASRIIMTGNLRSWRHFLLMHTTKEAHPQMKQVTIPLLSQFKATIPLLYADIEPNTRQIDSLRLPR